jgi:cell division protein FtsI/penicillin-binding protein 2
MNSRTEIRNYRVELAGFRRRMVVAAGFVVVMFLLLLSRFVYVQVLQYQHYHTLAENNRISLVPTPPNRGLILDRNGVVLAHNYSAYTLEITPSKTGNLDATLDALGQIVEVTPGQRKRFAKLMAESRNFETLPLRAHLSDEEVARLAANRYRLPGVEVQARLFRQYPLQAPATHLLGYIGRINDKDVERLQAAGVYDNYRGSDHIGKVGIEQSYERELHGVTGAEQVETDAGGHAGRVLARTPPVSGNSLVLYLDSKLQAIAEQAFGHYRGALVAIDPRTGGVLAFVSQPGYDPNLFVDGAQPCHARQLPGRLHAQAVHCAGRVELRRAQAVRHHRRSGLFHAAQQQSPLPRLESRWSRYGGYAQGHRAVLRYLFLSPGQRPRHRPHARLSGAVRLRRENRHRHGRRVVRRAAVTRMESQTLENALVSR